MKEAREIWIKGLVQGVGFRPFIYKLALRHNLNGQVENNNLGVRIVVEGLEENIKPLFKTFKKKPRWLLPSKA